MTKMYTLELCKEFDGWHWFQMDGPLMCEDCGGPFPSREAAEADAYEVCGDVFFETEVSA